MEKKYYQPTIEDYQVGLEYEARVNVMDDKWMPLTVLKDNIELNLDRFVYNIDTVRIPYIDKEDFESLGWKLKNAGEDIVSMEKGDYRLLYHTIDNKLLPLALYITRVSFGNSIPIFSGKCKSKNELKQILKFLDI